MVITPDIKSLPFIVENGIKYFELVAEQVKQEILPGIFINAYGYNGSTPGPTIQVYPEDCICIRVYNRLNEPTSIHWHGLDIPNSMDGVPDVEPTPYINPGCYFDYYLQIINPPGTHMYHTHVDSSKQEMMGLSGAFIILDPSESKVQRDYFIMLQEFKLKGLPAHKLIPGTYDIDPFSHEFNFFTMNGRCYPYTSPLLASEGENIRIRLGNISMNSHPIHIHGHQFSVTASDGNSIYKANRLTKNTISVSPGETWDIEFLANNPGRWPFHCHIPHHMSNNMSRNAGGMFTVIQYINISA